MSERVIDVENENRCGKKHLRLVGEICEQFRLGVGNGVIGDLPTEIDNSIDYANREHVKAMVAAGFVLLFDAPAPHEDSPLVDFFVGCAFCTAFRVEHAAYDWVRSRYGDRALNEFERYLQDYIV